MAAIIASHAPQSAKEMAVEAKGFGGTGLWMRILTDTTALSV